MPGQYEFSDQGVVQPPKKADCYLVPVVQWGRLEVDLEKASTWDSLLWTLTGIFGGSAASCITTFLTTTSNAAAAPGDIEPRVVYLILSVVLASFTLLFGLLAKKHAVASVAKEVLGKMRILKDGFRTMEHKK